MPTTKLPTIIDPPKTDARYMVTAPLRPARR
jgi:hypothetical protein